MKHFIQVFDRQIELTEEQAKALQEPYAPPSVKLAEVQPGETFWIGQHEFVVLEQHDGSASAICRHLIGGEILFGKSNCYENSAADKACNAFADEVAGIVGKENLLRHTVDLTSDDGLKDYGSIEREVSLLTADLYRRFVYILDLHNVDSWWWLSTPCSTKRHENDRWVKCVSPSGGLGDRSCGNGHNGVRPFCILKSDIFVSK